MFLGNTVEEIQKGLSGVMQEYLNMLEGNIYPLSFFINGLLNKSHGLLEGIKIGIEHKNIYIVEILIRSLYENLILLCYINTHKNGKEIYENFNSEKGFTIKTKKGKFKAITYTDMDRHFREGYLKQRNPLISKAFINIFKYGSKYTHFSQHNINESINIEGDTFTMGIGNYKEKWEEGEILKTKNISINIGNSIIDLMQLINGKIKYDKNIELY